MTTACSCSGKIITGCNNEYGEPYAYIFRSTGPGSDAGGDASGVDASWTPVDDGGVVFSGTCDPNAAP